MIHVSVDILLTDVLPYKPTIYIKFDSNSCWFINLNHFLTIGKCNKEKISSLSKCFSRNKYGNQILCEICTTDEQVLATHFCKTCEDPDPLCENCANRHLKEKLSKHHEICENMKDFHKR